MTAPSQKGDVFAERFELIDVLGRGGLGAVWRARDRVTRREVALKRLRGEFAADAKLRRRMRREARAVARLEHANIVRLYDLGEDPEHGPFLAMEIVEGPSLYRLNKDGEVDRETAIRVVDQMLSALAFAHARGVVHRDIKPENVVMAANAEGQRVVKLLDFGLARVEDDADDQLTNVGKDVFGTPIYMAPEQATGEFEVGPASDLYAMGIVTWELLTGGVPFTGDTGTAIVVKHVTSPLPEFKPRFSLPAETGEFLQRALEKEPANRFPSAGAMRRAFLGLFEEDDSEDEMTMVNEPPRIEVSSHDVTLTQVEALPIAVDSELLTTDGFVAPLLLENAPLVGRDDVQRWLWQRVVQVCRDKGQRTILLEGPVGIGKSRLCRWLRESLVEGGWMNVVGGLCRPGGRNGGFRDVVRGAFETVGRRLASPDTLGSALAGLDFDGRVDREALTAFLWPSTQKPLPLGAAKRVVEQVVRALAARRPLLLWLDDLHRATGEEFAIFEHLAEELSARQAPVLLLGTRRSDGGSLLGVRPGAATVDRFLQRQHDRLEVRDLGPISGDAAEALVEQYIVVDGAAIGRIINPARGNPLHILRALQYYMLRRDMEQAGELVRLSAEAPALPTGLKPVTRHRIDEMLKRHPPWRRILDLLALLGDVFPFGLADAMVRAAQVDPTTLEGAIDGLVRAGLLVDESGDAFAFEHELVREALLDAISRSEGAAALHGWAAQAKREWYADGIAAVAAEIAAHAYAAGDLRGAAEAMILAGGDARQTYRFEAASTYFAEADRWLNQSAGTELDELRADLALDSAELALDQGDSDRAGRLAWRVERWAAAAKDHARVARAQLIAGRVRAAAGRWGEAQKILSEVRGAFAALGEPASVARSDLELGQLAIQRADLSAAADHFAAAAQGYELAEDWLGLSLARRATGVLTLRRGERKEAARALHEAARLAKKAGDPLARGQATHALAELLLQGGKAEAAAKVFADAASAFEAAGRLADAALSLRAEADVHRALGRFADAEARYQRAERMFNREGLGHDRAICLMKMGRLGEDQGQPARALDRYERALAALQAFDDPLRIGLVHGLIARAAQRAGDPARRERQLAAAFEFDARNPLVVGEWARILEELAETTEDVVQARPLWARAAEVWIALRRPEDARRCAARAKG